MITGVPVWPGDPVADPVATLWDVGCLLLGGPIGQTTLLTVTLDGGASLIVGGVAITWVGVDVNR